MPPPDPLPPDADVAVDRAVRRATPDDLEALRSVYRRASLSNEGDVPLLTARPELLDLDESGVHEGRTFAGVEAGRVVAFARLSHHDGAVELEALFTDPDHRRAGHATRLVDAVVDTARRAGASRVEVTANEHAMAFYEQAGFVQVGMATLQYGVAPRMHLSIR